MTVLFKNALAVMVVMVVFFTLPAKAQEFASSNASVEFGAETDIVMPFTLNLFSRVYSDEETSSLSLASIEPASGADSYSAGGFSLSVKEEQSSKGEKHVTKMEFSYAPADNIKIKTRSGGLMLYKRVNFMPTRVPDIDVEQGAAPPPF